MKRKSTLPLFAASIVFAILLSDVLIAKFQILTGTTRPVHLGETAQFLLLLIAVVLFVIGTLREETLVDREDKDQGQ